MAGGGGGGPSFESTPSWVIGAVVLFMVAISLAIDKLISFTGQKLKTKEKNHLYEALQKIKDELMLLGFVSLLLAVLQDEISSICIPQKFVMKWIPCNAENVQISTLSHRRRRLLAQEDGTSSCPKMGSSYNAEAMKRLDSQASNRTDDRIPERTNNTDASVEMANQPRGQ